MNGYGALALVLAALGCASAAPTATRPPAPAPALPRPAPASLPRPPGPPVFSARALMHHVERLTSAELAGRQAGTAGERAAADYVAARLDACAVGPLPEAGRFQRFPLRSAGVATGATSLNTLGLIPAQGDLAGELVLLGAHLDALGVREGALHPGADDDASGVAVVLEVACALQERRTELGRSILPIFFGAEEEGLQGAEAFLRRPPVPLGRIAAMVNVDGIGRPLADMGVLLLGKVALGIDSARSVAVLGAGSRPALRRTVTTACREADVDPVMPEELAPLVARLIEVEAQGRTDDWEFGRAGIPALLFSSGEPSDYHTPRDSPARLWPELMARRALAIYRTLVGLSRLERTDLAAGAAGTPVPGGPAPRRSRPDASAVD
ncbi:MAG: M20/M25/M40 family metallo-hydrolase [Deltaproteobacteria bacterium]|nr:M20/M25/M40 family metallo-hydrolase [Deltaproteobacteria bacterium]